MDKNIVDLKIKINEIEEQYKNEIDILKAKLKEVTDKRDEELDPYRDQFGQYVNDIINGKYEFEPGGPISIRQLNAFEIEDPSLVPDKYWSPDVKLIKERLMATGYTENIPGVKVFKKKSVSVRTK